MLNLFPSCQKFNLKVLLSFCLIFNQFWSDVADKSVANACMSYSSGTKTWREGQFRLRNFSTNSYWHERLTVFFSYNLFFPLMIPYIFLQATFFSFTIYNLRSPHLIQSFDFQVNFTQNMQFVTLLLIVVLLFTTKSDPFLSAFHNV